MPAIMLVLVALVSLAGCTGRLESGPAGRGGVSPDDPNTPFTPAPAAFHRLTRAEYLASVTTLLGDDPAGTGWTLPSAPGDLPSDTALHGFSTVGHSEITISPIEVELYEAAAESIVREVLAPERRLSFVGCDVASEGEACTRSFVARVGRLAWRRPLTTAEVDALSDLATRTAALVSDPWQGAGYALSAILQSPDFLFRVEVGEPDPTDRTRLRYSSVEMASRLAFLVWGGPPDDALLRAGERGDLVTDAGITREVLRLLDDPRADAAIERFLSEFFVLSQLDLAQKNAEMFPEWSAGFRDSARTEVLSLLRDVWDRDADVRSIFSTDATFVDTTLAAYYGLPDPGPGMLLRTRVPTSDRRGGILGRPAILSTWSHETVNSPTRLGKFVLMNVLCEDISPPPPGIGELPVPTMPMTRRERLETLHVTNPVCRSCHERIDPLGFPFEGFDPIGHPRALDNGRPVRTDVTLVDGTEVADAAALGAYLAASDAVGRCVARRYLRYGLAHLELRGELPEFFAIEDEFGAGGYRLRALVLDVALSRAFRAAAFPRGECDAGDVEECTTACGMGERTCSMAERWGECVPPVEAPETCNGIDDDCDGIVDDVGGAACSSACGAGTMVCGSGGALVCSAPAPGTEACNHADDDCDGTADEGFGAQGVSATYTALRGFHPTCDGGTERVGLECNESIHAFCSMGSDRCGASGFGPVENSGDGAQVICVPAVVVDTSYAELAGHHAGCDGSRPYSTDCNAAIHRFCGATGRGTGYGPVRAAGGVQVACVPGAEVVTTTYTELSAHHAGCTTTTRIGGECNAAMHRFCIARGAVSGFGPLESSGDTAVVACVR